MIGKLLTVNDERILGVPLLSRFVKLKDPVMTLLSSMITILLWASAWQHQSWSIYPPWLEYQRPSIYAFSDSSP